MAIVLNSSKYHIELDSEIIIGAMGEYDKIFNALSSDNVYYLDKLFSVSNKKVSSLLDNTNNKTIELLKEYNLGEEVLNKKINELSHSEQKLLKYVLMLLSNKKIIIIDEPFLDLDYENKKKISLLIKRMVKDNKTIIIGSNDSNIIYSLCKKVLFINDNDYYYGSVDIMKNDEILRNYHIEMPDLVYFTDLARKKNIKVGYFKDVRDLIKDVYRNVSQK